MTSLRPVTVRELHDWELNGAVWRTLEVSDRHAVIELCSCSGEAMERVQSEEPEVIELARVHEPD